MSARRAALLISGALALLALLAPAAANAAFGFEPAGFTVSATNQDATPTTQAGAHPYTFTTNVALNTAAGSPDGELRDLTLHLPPGLLLNPTTVSECPAAKFHTHRASPYEASAAGESCPNASQVGVVAVNVGGTLTHFGLFNLSAPFGTTLSLGASPFGIPLVFDAQLRESDYGFDLRLQGLSKSLDPQGIEVTIWGTPWWGDPSASSHDAQRGNCLNEQTGGSWGSCLVNDAAPAPESLIHSFATMPTTPCGAELSFSASATSWQGETSTATTTAPALVKCNKALSTPKVQLMSDAAAARTGLAFNLAVNDGGGITNPGGIARPAIKTAIVSLPEGLTINPSLGAGLGTCSQAQFDRESAQSEPGAGCPNNSKIGDVEVEGTLGLGEALKGSLYLATPRANPYGSLIALYILARLPQRGLIVKSIGQLQPDPHTGRLVATFDELPRLLYTHFSLTLREGQRSTMVSPPLCGTYPTTVAMASWADPTVFANTASAFAINHGEGGGPCPPGGLSPFAPGLVAGSINPAAGATTPFYLRMTRTDAEQEITSYSAAFPPGVLGKIAGVPYCPEAAIAAAKQSTGIQERQSPSCPQASLIGRTEAGFGVGGVLAWAPGSLYLAGPYRGAPLSVVAIDSALVGPFDLGVVVVRSAIRIDPRSAQVRIDSAGSDPIPHILEGIPLHLRDIRVYVERPGFMSNPTSCDPMAVLSSLSGAGTDLFSPTDDPSATSTQRYQVLNCTALGFKPRLSFKLTGKASHRGQFPTLRATYTPRPGDANLKAVAVTLPHSLFLEQRHIGTVCTRVQYRAKQCPAGSVYGKATATSPLLDEPLSGPVYLRASDHSLPDIVASLQGRGIEIEVPARIDKANEGIRASFEALPDAPVSKFTMTLNGGRKAILVIAGGICSRQSRANARFVGHNSGVEVAGAGVRGRCGKGRRGHG